jgi:hypothetical protein
MDSPQQEGTETAAMGNPSISVEVPSDDQPPIKTTRTNDSNDPVPVSTTTEAKTGPGGSKRKFPQKNTARKSIKGLKHLLAIEVSKLVKTEIDQIFQLHNLEGTTNPSKGESGVWNFVLPKIREFVTKQFVTTGEARNLEMLGLHKRDLALQVRNNELRNEIAELRAILQSNGITPPERPIQLLQTLKFNIKQVVPVQVQAPVPVPVQTPEQKQAQPVNTQPISERVTFDGTEGISIEVPDCDAQPDPNVNTIVRTGWNRLNKLGQRHVDGSNVVTPESVLPEILLLSWVRTRQRFDWVIPNKNSFYSGFDAPGQNIVRSDSRNGYEPEFKLLFYGDSCMSRIKNFFDSNKFDNLDRQTFHFEAASSASAGQRVPKNRPNFGSFIEGGPQDPKTGRFLHRRFDIGSFSDVILWVGRNDISSTPRNGRVQKSGKWLADELFYQVSKLRKHNRHIRAYICTPTPSPNDVSKDDIDDFLARAYDNLERQPALARNISVIQFGLNDDSNKIRWADDKVHPLKNDIYTNTFFWELVNAVSSYGRSERLGTRPYDRQSDDDSSERSAWDSWSGFWEIDDVGRKNRKIYRN